MPRNSDAPELTGKALVVLSALDPFYPIVDSAAWVGSARSASARFSSSCASRMWRGRSSPARRAKSLALCRKAGATLVVNDDWRIAIDEGADWLHLGQEDLDEADLAAIRRAGLRLGVSTRDEAELERGLAVAPDYVAFGPMFRDHLQGRRSSSAGGLPQLAEWKRASARCRSALSAGIDLDRAKLCLAAGADLVSVISDITLNADPEARAKQWIAATRPK